MRPKPNPAALERLADEDLMTLVDRKDPDAFEVFYDRHGGAAYSLAHRIVGDRGMAEDVTQEAFLSIWRSRARYDPARGSVRAWALGIVRNRAIDALRRSARPVPKLDSDDELALEAQPASERTEAEAIRRETAGRLRQALGLLPREQSQVIELAYFGGFSHSEIAAMLGAPLGTIKGRMRLGLEKIRATLAEGMPGEDVPGAYL
jgi:RNA polymerase sigma-70 factor (ECF subfamily)